MGRIVIVIRRFFNGSASNNRILAYAKGFAEQGQKVSLYFLVTDKNREKYNIDIPNVDIRYMWESDGILARKNKYFSYIKNLLRVHAFIEKGDTIFFYNSEWLISLFALFLHHKACIFTETTEHPLYKGNSWRNRLIAKIRLFCINRFDGLFVISQSLKNYFSANGIEPNKIHIINMFVDSTRFSNLKHLPRTKYIAYCGSISIHKDGVDDLIKAFTIFHRDHPDFKLYIIGNFISETDRSVLEALVKEYNIKNSIIFTGAQPADKLPQLLYDAEILALARPNNLQAQNGFPTKLGEYLATGNPVVVTKVGDIPEFIEDGKNGFLSDPDNPQSFSEKLSWVADNIEQAREIGQNGKDLAYSDFSYYIQTQKALKMMDMIVSSFSSH